MSDIQTSLVNVIMLANNYHLSCYTC